MMTKWSEGTDEPPGSDVIFICDANYNTAFTLKLCTAKYSSFNAGMKKTDKSDEYLDFSGETLEPKVNHYTLS